MHVFAAQAGTAVVHVYSREKGGNQEATAHFPDRISSIALAGGDILVLGTEGGRLFLWEVCIYTETETIRDNC